MKHEASVGENGEQDGNNKIDKAGKPGDGDDDDSWCPLFMNGLPSDFSTNPSLAALASLLDSDDDDDATLYKKKTSNQIRTVAKPKAGGGKVLTKKTRSGRAANPYPVEKRPEKKPSLGEAQLFLQMWKISK